MTKTALVTGASAGFGEAISRRLVADGWRVVACARRADKLAALHEELGEALLVHVLDVTDARAVAALADSLPEGWRELDLLVNNAGLAMGMDPAQTADLQGWDTMVAVNVTGLMHVTRALLPGMLDRGRGLIVNLGSTAANYAYPGGNVYGASKAFVEQFTLGLKADLIGTGVRVSCIEPGMVGGTEFSAVRFGGDQARAAKVYEGVDPLTPEDIAETVAWIAGLPPHMNVNLIELMPTCQAPAAPAVKRS
ncbi:SDR family NAD(P)-dependent oxidoreductase [Caulobacter sp. S45]|uniref:SDR family NAD(P)-dependent oxidoreductase n=1 Tax=Caulobacter sp. S45 TaxID=1641861 RepID=UPI001576A68E|nr:SDR family NAD(P)-dependent oxidoreductase [Caulobacter sp. S45]